MFKPTLDEFVAYCDQGNLIPVFQEHLADMETPVSALARFADDEHVFLLESVEGGERWGRYSFIGIHPRGIFTVSGGVPTLTRGSKIEQFDDFETPFLALRRILERSRPVHVPGLPRFFGGVVGWVGYETVCEFEQLPPPKTDLDAPTACMMMTDEMIIFDNVRHTAKVVASVRPDEYNSPEDAYAAACRRIEKVESKLTSPRQESNTGASSAGQVTMSSNFSRGEFCDSVKRAKGYISEGDVIQVVLSQRFSTEANTDALSLYRALRLINPSPYTFFLKFGKKALVGSSPEVMVRLTDDVAELRPIAGTRPRGATEQEDRSLADSLLADEKERAEHVMLVDLGRNDLGRVAMPGSVQVKDFMRIERYSHVMHIVSDVNAILRNDMDAFDLFRSVFPAGTLSGAPKIRAMEIINELEPGARGAYGGAVGYLGYDGNMDMAITIRTLETDGEEIAVQAGAGIVADSDPEREYEETVHKAKGMVRAIELAARGFDLK